jgi:transcriptional regulator with XRE-family HTH domain
MMRVRTPGDLVKVIDTARALRNMSERELSALAGKSPSMYWWWKKKVGTTSFQSVLTYCEALGLMVVIEPLDP